MAHLSKARTWEHKLKTAAWGVDEAGFLRLPRSLRIRIWNEAMLRGPKCGDPDPETRAMILDEVCNAE